MKKEIANLINRIHRLSIWIVGVLLVVSCMKRNSKTVRTDVLPLQDYKSSTLGMMALPPQTLSLKDLQAFRSPGNNWHIAGGAISKFEKDHSLEIEQGDGILVNIPRGGSKSDIYTKAEYGDLELKAEVLVPRASNSGIYFQGRYEIQIFDSWGIDDASYGGMGGIYQRWDESKSQGEQGFDGEAPKLNAALAPGLWQDLHVLFRAPRFNKQGKKIKNAKFEKVFLNGKLIHENVELTGPTRGAISQEETALAPLRFQGSHGPVAFRNIGFKRFDRSDSLKLGPLDYKVYKYNRGRGRLLLPEREAFDTLSLLAEGVTDSFNVMPLSPVNERFIVKFSGDLHVPVSGDYLFQTLIATGGNLYIDGDLITTDTGRSYFTLLGNTIYLDKGIHQLEISYFKRRYVSSIALIYEGPNMERRTLASKGFELSEKPEKSYIKQPKSDSPELIRSFVRYGDENQTFVHTLGQIGPEYKGFADPATSKKRTHALSVGHPEGIHYTYDLDHSLLLKFWRGPFADVSTLRQGRGEMMLLPLGVALENKTRIPLVRMSGKQLRFFQNVSEQLSGQEYFLNDANRPVFKFNIGDVNVEDEIFPANNARDLNRVLRYTSEKDLNNIASVITQGEQIDKLTDRLFRIKNYYIRLDKMDGAEASIYENNGVETLAIPVLRESRRSEIHYRIIW